MKEIEKLTAQNEKLAKLFREEQDQVELKNNEIEKKAAKIEQLQTQSQQLKENLDILREENEELQANCEVIEEEYNKLQAAQNNTDFIQSMQNMKSSFTGHRRESRNTKDSFVKGGGLGSELEGLKYKPAHQEVRKDSILEAQEEEYHELQIEDINMNEYTADEVMISGSFLGN